MDLLFQAISLFRRRQFEKCVEVTSRLLEKNPNDQVNLFILYTNFSSKILGNMVTQNACINRTTLC